MSGKSKKVKGTKQTFEFVEKQKKFHVKQIKCLNSKQKEFVKSIENKEITFCSGPAGSGKTFMALWTALKLLEKNQFEQIILAKSVTSIPGEEIGILPGEIYEKMDPFLISFFGNIDKLIGEEERKRLIKENKIKIQPLMYIRGINIDKSIVILDEAQNINLSVFKTIITRIGSDSKYIICGDVEQIDLKKKSESSLAKLMELFQNDDLIGVVQFNNEDCVRNPIIPHLLNKIKTIE